MQLSTSAALAIEQPADALAAVAFKVVAMGAHRAFCLGHSGAGAIHVVNTH